MLFNSLFGFSFCNILNSLLNMYHGIMLSSLPVSIWYGIIILLLPAHISNSAVNSEWFLFRCTESALTVSILLLLYSWHVSTSILFTTLLLLLKHTFLKCPILPHPACLPICWALSWWVYTATILTWLPLQCPANWSSSSVYFCPFGYFYFVKLPQLCYCI